MQEDREKILQQLLDSDRNLKQAPFKEAQEDFDAYKVLFSALKQESRDSLPFDFKAKVLQQIRVEQKSARDFKLNLIIGIVVLTGIMVVVFLALSYSDVLIRYLQIIIKVVGLICISVVSLTIFHFVEEKYPPIRE